MTRGSTPAHVFTLPFSVETIKTVEITYEQNEEVKLKKTNIDCTLEENTVSVKLTQEDTFKFDEKPLVKIQIRVLTLGGDDIASDIMYATVKDSLSDEVLI